jgi:hypothetical protein
VHCNGEKLFFALSIKFNKLVVVSLSFSVLLCQSEFGHHTFLIFYWLLPSLCHIHDNSYSCCYPSCSNPGESGCALPRHRKTHNIVGAMVVGHPVTQGWAARSVPLTSVAKTCTGLGVQPFRPDGPSIATSMPDGASNSRCMCLVCGPFRHLERQRGGVTENTVHPGEERWWPTCADKQGCRHGRCSSNPSRPSDAR